MNSSPKVAVIIPTYNRPQLLMRAIQSVLAQTYADFEILVMDDSRNDDTKIAMAAIKDPRVHYHYNKERLGFVENKNQGVRLANPSSPYVALLDDDDTYLPLFLERTVAVMNADSECMAVCTDSELRRQDGSFIMRYACERERFWHVSLGNGVLLRKDIFLKFNIWYDNVVLFEDLDFGIRVTKDHVWKGIPEVLRVYYRYPAAGDKTPTASFFKSESAERIERFFVKHKETYEIAGNEALGWIHDNTGKVLVRAGHLDRGRWYLKKAIGYDPRPSYVRDYVAALIFPQMFNNLWVITWKNRIKGIFSKG